MEQEAQEIQPTHQLNRTMGLVAATAIGVGTMVGAGIFVFPGIAGGYAGPAAMVSFAIGGIIALLVALCTAELATALPESGGGYYFISRSFGPLWGTLIGIAQWVGLVFACSFYLAGFGEYALKLLGTASGESRQILLLSSIGATLLLFLINLIGTKNVGRFQNLIVVTLTLLLLSIFSYGFLDISGIIGEPRFFEAFTPRGTRPVFSTTALIFTSYLGFVQISTVAGEIKAPQRNLPRALIGSVLIVLFFYLFVLLVTTSVLSVAELQQYRETATLEVARRLIGDVGALIILAAGLLATLSSANASMLSSSRAIFALSKDQLVPSRTSRINERFGTPHLALLLVAIPAGGLLLVDNLEFFAEVASFLHLLIYAGICLALLRLRRRRPAWYAPTFRVPFGRIVAPLGALTCFSLIFFMDHASILVGGLITLCSAGYYLLYKQGVKLPNPHPPHIDTAMRTPRILIPIDLSEEPTAIPQQLLTSLRASEVFVLGYWEIPEQTEPEQAEEEYGTEAQDRLETVLSQTEENRIDTKKELVFTKDPTGSVRQTIEEERCHALLTARPTEKIQRVLVPIYEDSQINLRLSTLLQELTEAITPQITFLIMEQEDDEGEGLRAQLKSRLQLTGISGATYQKEELADQSPEAIMKKHTDQADLVLLVESDPAERERFFDTFHQKIERATDAPVLVVLQESSND